MKIKIPKYFTTVTDFSKLVALILLIFFPIIGFELGMQYQLTVDAYRKKMIDMKTKDYRAIASPTPTIAVTDTSTWKTYTHTKFGYSFKYPSDMEIRSFSGIDSAVDSIISIYNPRTNERVITFNSRSYQQKITLLNALRSVFVSEPNIQGVAITVNNHPALIAESESIIDTKERYKMYTVLIQKDDYNYKIVTSNGIFPRKNEEDKFVFDQILSTFKFASATPTAQVGNKNQTTNPANTQKTSN